MNRIGSDLLLPLPVGGTTRCWLLVTSLTHSASAALPQSEPLLCLLTWPARRAWLCSGRTSGCSKGLRMNLGIPALTLTNLSASAAVVVRRIHSLILTLQFDAAGARWRGRRERENVCRTSPTWPHRHRLIHSTQLNKLLPVRMY